MVHIPFNPHITFHGDLRIRTADSNINCSVDEISPVAHRIPEYIATHESNSILNPMQSPFSWANNAEGENFYNFLLEHPKRLARFNKAMTTQEAQLPVLGMFPFSSLATTINKSDSQRAFIVDVAGGRGQSLLQIKKEMETTGVSDFGRCILQDRKPVLDAIPDDQLPGIEKMVIDFFNPQPVKRAGIPFFPHILLSCLHPLLPTKSSKSLTLFLPQMRTSTTCGV